MQNGIEEIVYNILRQGHYVNITTNGTITSKIRNMIDMSQDFKERLHFSFSFHYLELKRLNLVQTFFDNIRMVKEAKVSYMIQFNMCDEYIPYLEEIKDLCIKNAGAAPQIAATRKEEKGLEKIQLMTSFSDNEYMAFGNDFHSDLYQFTLKNFNVKRKEFCYAGDWAVTLDLSTGIMRRCYSSYIYQNIFKNPKEKIRFLAMGNCCGSPFCMNSSHFMALGVIPDVTAPTYAALRNRPEASWYQPKMREFLSSKLEESNMQYGVVKKGFSNLVGVCDGIMRRMYRIYKRKK